MISHTFAVCAYKESPYLEACIQSLLGQSVKTSVFIATSTPNEHIRKVADQYGIPVYVNEGEHGITQDWNFAYRMADTELVTIAHQDDVYLPDYTKNILRLVKHTPETLIAFTDYGELRDGKAVLDNSILKIKRLLLMPLRCKGMQKSIFVRRRILSLGNPICCPAVTFKKTNLPEEVFSHGFRSNEDWEAWEMLSKKKGVFAYTKEIGMYHRIHEGSETSIIIGDHARKNEDFEMFCKFWPKSIARILSGVYAKSEKSNEL